MFREEFAWLYLHDLFETEELMSCLRMRNSVCPSVLRLRSVPISVNL
jgi:hypothetical protein